MRGGAVPACIVANWQPPSAGSAPNHRAHHGSETMSTVQCRV
jgi:hypothetical protein